MTTKSSEALDQHDEIDEVKNEIVEEEKEEYVWPTPDHTPKLMYLGSILPQTSNFNTTRSSISNPLPSSKRKRQKSNKAKDMHSEIKRYNKSSQEITNLSGKLLRCKQENTAIVALSSSKSAAMIRAEEVRRNLGTDSPSFLKLLVRSHVVTGFWMSLPVPFCKSHLPRKDTMVILEDESGANYYTKYIVEKTGLSGGWKRFAVHHQLLEGDVLVFHLVEPEKFKVFIIRTNDLTDVDGALSLLNLDTVSKQIDTEKVIRLKRRRRTASIPVPLTMEKSGNDSEPGSEILEGSKFTSLTTSFTAVENFEDFHLTLNNSCIDSEIPESMLMKYYELCKSQNTFLHEKIIPGLYYKLVAGIIGETVKIADSIRSCKLTTTREEIGVWEKSLESFSLLGMNVGFLRGRIQRLLSLAFDLESGLQTKRYLEAKTERKRVETEIMNLETRVLELKEVSDRFGADIENLKPDAERFEIKFLEEINAQW